MNIALIDNMGTVVNIIDGDMAHALLLGYAQAIEVTAATGDAHMHGTFANGVFVAPAPPPALAPPPPSPVMSKLAFLQRLTQAERIGIRQAIPTDPVIADAESMLGMADSVDVSAADTTNYVGYLVSKSLLTAARATTILTP